VGSGITSFPVTLPFEIYAVCKPIVWFVGEPVFLGR
jgi:hypothetical protein